MHRLTRVALLAVSAGALAATCVAPAAAAPASPAAPAAAPAAPTAATPSCVVRVGFAPLPTTACYGSLGAALTVATGGALRSASAAAGAPEVALDAAIDAANTTNAPTRDGTVIGIEYFDRNYAGYSWVVTTPAGCGPDKWELDDLGDWDNQISSFRAYAGCQADHFDLVGYKGARTGLLAKKRYIGDKLNDRTSAIRWS